MRLIFARMVGKRWVAWVILALGLTFSVLALFLLKARIESEARLRFDNNVMSVSYAIQSRIWSYYDVLYGVQGLFKVSDAVTRADFRKYASSLNLRERYPGFQVLSFSRYLQRTEIKDYEERVRRDTSIVAAGYPDFKVKPPGDRAEYYVVDYIEPMAGNDNAFGFDLHAEPLRVLALERARDTGEIVASGRLVLVSSRQVGFSLRVPVYRNEMPLRTEKDRRDAFIGVVSATFVIDELIPKVVGNETLQNTRIQIFDAGFFNVLEDAGTLPGNNMIYDSGGAHTTASTPSLRWFTLTQLTQRSKLNVGGRLWDTRFTELSGFTDKPNQFLPLTVFGAGTLTSLLLFALFRSLAARSRRGDAIYRSVIAVMAEGIVLRDARGRIVSCNASAERILGRTLDQMKGDRLFDPAWVAFREDGAPLPDDERPAELAVRTGQMQSNVVVGFRRRAGRMLWLSMNAQSLYETSKTVPSGIVTTFTDITERRQSERRQVMEHAITGVLASAETLAEAIPNIIQTICGTMRWQCGARWAWDKQAMLLRYSEAWGTDIPAIQEFIAASANGTIEPDEAKKGLVRRTFRSGQPHWVADIAQVDGLVKRAGIVRKAGLHGSFAFALVHGTEVLGVMEFFHTEVRPPDEMLIASAASIGSQIGQYMVRKEAEERARHLAHYDELTGIPNRAMFNLRLSHALAQAKRSEKPLAVLFIDLDRFKNINDTLGHEAGDLVLKTITARLLGCLRESDTVARLGGDEFVVLIEESIRPIDIAGIAEKILAAVAQPIRLEGQEFHVTASIGISTYPDDCEDLQGLMKYADISMYRAKEQGKNNYQFFSSQKNEHTVSRLALESNLRRALERNEFVLHYQPKIDVASGRVTGVEALVRWQRPSKPLLMPLQFIPLAEETGLIVPIGAWVLNTACAQSKALRAQGMANVRVAVNVSARQLRHENLFQDVARALEEHELDASALELEITESVVIQSPEQAITLLSKLKEMGIRLSIDDFGTGYSSLSYLKRLPIDAVKIDRSFIRDLPDDNDDAVITRAIIAMAHSLKLSVIAEGVETDAQLAFLRQHGCDEMQGYYFSKPVPADQLSSLIDRRAPALV